MELCNIITLSMTKRSEFFINKSFHAERHFSAHSDALPLIGFVNF